MPPKPAPAAPAPAAPAALASQLQAQADALLAGTVPLSAPTAAPTAGPAKAPAPAAPVPAKAGAKAGVPAKAGGPGTALPPGSPAAKGKAKAKAKPKAKAAEVIKNEPLTPGVYQTAEGHAFGSLVGKCAGQTYAWMITNIKGAKKEVEKAIGVWAADLVPAKPAPSGHALAGKEAWKIVGGDRDGCMFVRDAPPKPAADAQPTDPSTGVPAEGAEQKLDKLIECDKDFNQKWVWELAGDEKGKLFSEPAGAPLKTFPSPNFIEAVIDKDPSVNEPFSPSTETIISACCGDDTLPEGNQERQEALMRYYTAETPLYHEMNTALRQDDLYKMKYFGAYIKELRNCFKTDHVDQITEPFEGMVWRGISFPDPVVAQEEYAAGTIFVWPAFTSMTTNRDVAIGFGNLVFEISCEPPAGTFEDDNPEYAPAAVQQWSMYASEAEILFPPNIKFKVKEIVQPPGPNGDLSSPLVVCETVGFDSDGGVMAFNEADKELAKGKDLWKTVAKQRKQIDAQSQMLEDAQSRIEELQSTSTSLGQTVKVLAAKLGVKCDDNGAILEAEAGGSASGDLEEELFANFSGKFSSYQEQMQGLKSSPSSPLKSGGLGDTLLPGSTGGGGMLAKCNLTARDLARQMAEEIDREMTREMTSSLDAEMGREMAREMARNMARVMARGVSRDMARKVVQSKMQGETYGVDDILFDMR